MAQNGTDLPKFGIVDPAQAACVQLLEQALQDARAGNVNTVAVVCVGPGGFGSAFAGPHADKLYLGLGACSKKLLSMVDGEEQQKPRKPTILHARPVG